jgi:hypothetical protein
MATKRREGQAKDLPLPLGHCKTSEFKERKKYEVLISGIKIIKPEYFRVISVNSRGRLKR